MKQCPQCLVTKDLSHFYKRPDRTNGIQSWCKSCFNTMSKALWKQRKLDAIQYLGGECIKCGYGEHPAAMQFHHLKDKKFMWNKMRMLSDKHRYEELDKCQLLCANCHAIIHSLSN